MTSVRAFREVTSTINQDPHYTDSSAVAVICGQLVTLKWEGICNLQCTGTIPLPAGRSSSPLNMSSSDSDAGARAALEQHFQHGGCFALYT